MTTLARANLMAKIVATSSVIYESYITPVNVMSFRALKLNFQGFLGTCLNGVLSNYSCALWVLHRMTAYFNSKHSSHLFVCVHVTNPQKLISAR